MLKSEGGVDFSEIINFYFGLRLPYGTYKGHQL